MPRPFAIPGKAPATPEDREVREGAVPPNPLDARHPDKWAPGIGQNSAQISQQRKPWPAAGPATPSGKPFKVG